MCNCLSFLLDNPALNQKWAAWAYSLSLLCRRLQSWSDQSMSGTEVELFGTDAPSPHMLSHKRISATPGRDGCSDGWLAKCGIHVIRRRSKPAQATDGRVGCAPTIAHEAYTDAEDENTIHYQESQAMAIAKSDARPVDSNAFFQGCPPRASSKAITNEGNDVFSLFTQQGLKGTNQDSMVVWENFIPSENATLCAVFDGHGPHGHHISRNVRDKLPGMLASCWQTVQFSSLLVRSKPNSLDRSRNLGVEYNDPISLWEETFHSAYKLMDRDLLIDEDVDCVFSGSTAVTLIKQGDDLIIANVGDSRAVLGVKFEDSLIALQLTVDLTPNLPKEAERIRRCKGRVLALRKEPFVKRVWLPYENSPGLAMARAFGDYILKDFGVISVPEVTHRRISKNDKFVVLATDGVWDVLSNDHVVHIVDSAPARSLAAQAVVDTAVDAWKVKHPDAKVDDCAVICLFLDSTHPESWHATSSPS